MLRRWSVENFKSVKGRVDLDLASLTILAGSNSSGKSTILHSMLLAKQTLRYSPPQRPLALNGPILKLGFFRDVIHSSVSEKEIGFGLMFDFSTEPAMQLPTSRSALIRQNFQTISFESKFSVKGRSDIEQLQPTLQFSAISAEYQPEIFPSETDDGEITTDYYQLPNLSWVIDKPREAADDEDGLSLSERSISVEARVMFHVADIDAPSQSQLCDDLERAEIVGAKSKHFLPSQCIIQYDQNATRAKALTERLLGLTSPYRTPRGDTSVERIPLEILELATGHLEQQGYVRAEQLPLFTNEDTDKTVSFAEAVKFLRDGFQYQPKSQKKEREFASARAPTAQMRLRAALQDADFSEDVTKIIAARLGPRIVRTTNRTDEQSNIVSYIDSFIGSRLKYIGPLRDEPKPLYPLEEVTEPNDVGYRGEHTAAVLELNRWTRVDHIPPSCAENGFSQISIESTWLIQATTTWLEYLGVATEVTISDMGKFGHGMQVRTDPRSGEHDLTNVGVGVSQVLPIVVMALLAPAESLLIFEQPELHLHPRVQSRLADFFVSLCLLGKQCIIETHSEYLIQRLRRRIAEAEGETLKREIKVYFVERKEGESSYLPITFSEYGAIADWPDDFFDQADREVESLLQAASKKRASKLKSKKQ